MSVRTPGGALRGERVGGVERFLGIPYAAAPVGARRWAPAEPAEPWDGERDATSPGPAPPQPERPINEWFHGPLVATDEATGLTLNVFAPVGEGEAIGEGSRPVLVWLHGGGWAVGWGSAPIFDATILAAALDAVVVTVNYRLGSLGWLHHPELGAPHGDWGFLDQVEALRWVRRSIAAFGGDPERVTVSGQSAGAGSTLHLLVSGAGGLAGEALFARAIALSPPLGEAVVPAMIGVEWAEALGDHLVGGFDLEALRAVPAAEIVAAHEELLTDPRFRGTRGGAMPIVLPGAIEHDPIEAPAVHPEIPLLIGNTVDEATFLFRAAGRRLDPDEKQLTAIVAHQRGVDDPAAVIAAYREANPGADNNELLCRIVTDKLFAGPVAEFASARAAAGAEVYRLRVEHTGPDERLASTHAIDVPLLFGTYATVENARSVSGDTPSAHKASAALQSAVRTFIHGKPPFPAEELRVIGA
ncbi:MAG: carboxylesterase family protein [Solirubrobacterales bacterium]